jgi:hypothetical protein
MGRACNTNGGEEEHILEGKRPLERPRCRWLDNIMMDLVEMGWDGVMWTGGELL